MDWLIRQQLKSYRKSFFNEAKKMDKYFITIQKKL